MRGSRAAELGKVTFQSRHPLPMFLRLDGTATGTGRCENMIYELKRLTTWIHCYLELANSGFIETVRTA
jgi:hypothetical protein